MTTVVSPESFRFVAFDADRIRDVADGLIDALGLTGTDLAIVVDETTPLSRVSVDVDRDRDAITVRVESGAFEDTRQPRQQSEIAVATSLGRVLLRARDRRSGGFADAPPDDDLTLAQLAAWEAYCVGRLERKGIAVNQQRWRYNFRNRHGFSDTSDAAFDRLWSSDGIGWDDLAEISRAAAGSVGASASAG